VRCRMACRIWYGQLSVTNQVGFGVPRRVSHHKSAAGLDVMLERAFLPIVEAITGGVEKDDCLVLRKVIVAEGGNILAGINSELIVPAQLLYGGDSVRNRVMTKAGC